MVNNLKTSKKLIYEHDPRGKNKDQRTKNAKEQKPLDVWCLWMSSMTDYPWSQFQWWKPNLVKHVLLLINTVTIIWFFPYRINLILRFLLILLLNFTWNNNTYNQTKAYPGYIHPNLNASVMDNYNFKFDTEIMYVWIW